MKAAAVDTALTELTTSGRFRIVKQGADPGVEGRLRFDLSLVSPAEIVKLKISFEQNNAATYVSSVAMDIHNMDYQGIYNAFEYVGTEAARRLNARLELAASQRGQDHRSADASVSADTLALYNEAQAQKRAGNIREARAMFEKVLETSSEEEWQWRKMAKEELRYGLPIFEAENLLLTGSSLEPMSIDQNMKKVAHLYRQILADNTDIPKRVVDINARLDNLSLSRRSVSNAIRANAYARVTQLRVTLLEIYMMEGEWPDKSMIEKQLGQMCPGCKIVRYIVKGDALDMTINDVKYDTEVRLKGSPRSVEIVR